MTLASFLALLKWLEPALPMLMEAFKKGASVESVFAVNHAALDVGFKSARARRAKRRAEAQE